MEYYSNSSSLPSSILAKVLEGAPTDRSTPSGRATNSSLLYPQQYQQLVNDAYAIAATMPTPSSATVSTSYDTTAATAAYLDAIAVTDKLRSTNYKVESGSRHDRNGTSSHHPKENNGSNASASSPSGSKSVSNSLESMKYSNISQKLSSYGTSRSPSRSTLPHTSGENVASSSAAASSIYNHNTNNFSQFLSSLSSSSLYGITPQAALSAMTTAAASKTTHSPSINHKTHNSSNVLGIPGIEDWIISSGSSQHGHTFSSNTNSTHVPMQDYATYFKHLTPINFPHNSTSDADQLNALLQGQALISSFYQKQQQPSPTSTLVNDAIGSQTKNAHMYKTKSSISGDITVVSASAPSGESPRVDSGLSSCGSTKAEPTVLLSQKDYVTSCIGQLMKEMFEKGEETDIILKTSGDKVEVRAHRAVLYACSPLLRKLIPEQSCCSCSVSAVTVEGTNGKDLRALVQSLYTGKLPGDCSLTGVNYTAAMLGLDFYVQNLQSSLRDEVNQDFLKRYRSDDLSEPAVTVRLVKSPTSVSGQIVPQAHTMVTSTLRTLNNSEESSSRKLESVTVRDVPVDGNEHEKRNSKRKSEDVLHLRAAKVPRHESISPLVSETSPLNLTKSSLTIGNSKSENNFSAATSIKSAPEEYALNNNVAGYNIKDLYNLGLCNAALNNVALSNTALNNATLNNANYEAYQNILLSLAQSQYPTAATNTSALALAAAAAGQFNNSVSSVIPQTKQKQIAGSSGTPRSKNGKASTSKTTNNKQSLALANEYLANLALYKNSLTAEQQQSALALVQGATTSGQTNITQYMADTAAQVSAWTAIFKQNMQPNTEKRSSDFDHNKDSSGALNLSADSRIGPKPSKSPRLETKDDTVTQATPVWNPATSLVQQNLVNFDDQKAVNPAALAVLSNVEYKPNGLTTPYGESSVHGLTNLNLLQKKTIKQPRKVSEGGSVISLQGADEPSLIEGHEDIIEIRAEIGTVGSREALYHATHGRRRKGCGTCENCLNKTDCEKCRFCLDKTKFGGNNKLKQVCFLKRCKLLDQKASNKTRCEMCESCLRTTDCKECYVCMDNAKAGPSSAKRQLCEMRVCEQILMDEVRANLNKEEPSPYSAKSMLTEAKNAAAAYMTVNASGSPICATFDESLSVEKKGTKKCPKKKPASDGKNSPPKARAKYLCNMCWGCDLKIACSFCTYCLDMPKFGGHGRFRQKCIKQLCILHPRLQSNRIIVEFPKVDVRDKTDPPPPQNEIEMLLEPFKGQFEAAAVTKTSMVNFLRLHHRNEDRDRSKQLAIMLDILSKRPLLSEPGAASANYVEDRGETPDGTDFSNDQFNNANGSTAGNTPEPIDAVNINLPNAASAQALYQTDRNRQLPDLRPIIGSTASTVVLPTAAVVATNNLHPSIVEQSYVPSATIMAESVVVKETVNSIQSQASSLQYYITPQDQGSQLKNYTETNKTNTNSDIELITVENNHPDPEVDVEKVELPEEKQKATDLTIKESVISVTSVNKDEIIPAADSLDNCEELRKENLCVPETLKNEVDVCSSESTEEKRVDVDVLGNKIEDPIIAENCENSQTEEDNSKDSNGSVEATVVPRRGRPCTRARRPSYEFRGRPSKSRSKRQSPSPVPMKTTRAKLREQSSPRRGNRRRTTRYSTVIYDNSDTEEVAEDLANQQGSDADDELVKVGSEDDEEDSRTADIQAAVQDVLNHELAEEEINRASKQWAEHCHRRNSVSYGSAAPMSEEQEQEDATAQNNQITNIDQQEGNNNSNANSAEAATHVIKLQQQLHVDTKQPQLKTTTVIETTKEMPVRNRSPLPKIKLRLNNGPVSVEKIETCDLNGVGS